MKKSLNKREKIEESKTEKWKQKRNEKREEK